MILDLKNQMNHEFGAIYHILEYSKMVYGS